MAKIVKLVGIDIEKAAESDARRIAEIEAEIFKEARSLDAIKSFIGNTAATFLTAKSGGEIVGYILIFGIDVVTLAVTKNYRGMGIARELIKRALKEISDSIFLEVREGNIAAISLYSSVGFKTVGRRQKYYDGAEDAIIMRYDK